MFLAFPFFCSHPECVPILPQIGLLFHTIYISIYIGSTLEWELFVYISLLCTLMVNNNQVHNHWAIFGERSGEVTLMCVNKTLYTFFFISTVNYFRGINAVFGMALS